MQAYMHGGPIESYYIHSRSGLVLHHVHKLHTALGHACISYYRLHFVTADPDMGELISYETEDSNGNCMVHVSWTLSSNNQIEDVELFMVFINGTNIKNETNINKTLATRVYPVCTCGTHAVNITAIDQCGNEGVSARHVTNNDLLLFEEGVCTDLNGGVDSGIRSKPSMTINNYFLVVLFFVLTYLQ